MTYFQSYLNEIDVDLLLWFLIDYEQNEYDFIDKEISDILSEELGVTDVGLIAKEDLVRFREIFKSEVLNQVLLRSGAIEELGSKEATLVNPRVFECRVIDQKRFNSVMENPELVLDI